MESSLWHPVGFLSRTFRLDFSLVEASFEREFNPVRLNWDSDFFGAEMYRLPPVYEEAISNSAVSGFIQSSDRTHLFAEVPAEASGHVRALGLSGFSLVETRLHYFHTLENLVAADQKVRFATAEDTVPLMRVASGAVNPFDRYHSDRFFSESEANRYLETYIANCVSGFAEKVFVPGVGTSPASFVAISRIKDPVWLEDRPLYRIPLTACLPENKGWHYPLCLAALHYAQSQRALALVMTTQATNRAVIHNCEKLGFKLGSCTHIFSISKS